MSLASKTTTPNAIQPPPTVEAMFQEIMHAVHRSVSGRVVLHYYIVLMTLDELAS